MKWDQVKITYLHCWPYLKLEKWLNLKLRHWSEATQWPSGNIKGKFIFSRMPN